MKPSIIFQRNLLDNEMKVEENKNLEYLSKVFKGLPTERKDDLLHTARQLLKIQEKDAFTLPIEKSLSKNERQRVV